MWGAPRVAQQLGIARSVELAEPVDPMTAPIQSAAEIAQDNAHLLVRGSGPVWLAYRLNGITKNILEQSLN